MSAQIIADTLGVAVSEVSDSCTHIIKLYPK